MASLPLLLLSRSPVVLLGDPGALDPMTRPKSDLPQPLPSQPAGPSPMCPPTTSFCPGLRLPCAQSPFRVGGSPEVPMGRKGLLLKSSPQTSTRLAILLPAPNGVQRHLNGAQLPASGLSSPRAGPSPLM